jgi:hypothetical protein
MATTFTGVPIADLDANLKNGHTYTFQFKCDNLFCFSDLSQTIVSDLAMQAPDFVQSVQVKSPTGGGWFAATAALYNVQFTYEGDGSDIVSDLANVLIAAVKTASNDNLVFVGAVDAPASDVVVTPSNAASATEKAVVDAASKTANDAVKAATDAVNQALTGLLPLLIVVVLLILFVVPSFVKSTGVKLQAG